MRLNRLGIRARITGGSLLIAIVISVVAGLIIRNQVQHIVYDGEVSVLRSITAPYKAELLRDPTAELDPPGGDQEAAVVNPDGVAVINTLQRSLRPQLPDLVAHDTDTRTVIGHGIHYLVSVTTVKTPQGTWSIVAARNGNAQASVLNSVTLLLIVALAIINLAFAAASWFIGTATLSPVNRLRRSASELASRPDGELLPVGPADDEISQLASTLNELIGELRSSADRERQIVSDASHELRTPLAILQTKLELAQSQAKTLGQMRTEVASAQQTLHRLSALATSLLELSRIDAQSARGSATVDQLSTELADAADRGRLRVGAGEVVIDFAVDLPSSTRAIAISPHDFGRVCDNLVNNALAARPESGTIQLTLRNQPGGVLLTVDDEAGGMDEAFVAHAFDRFARDAMRSADSTGAGLGLAIVSAIVSLAGGDITLVNAPGIGLRVDITLPFARPDTPKIVKRGD
ncbi:MAG: HAMP domain-containing sensor histidine kinase [Pseudolysinimonas sp.]